MTARFGLIQKSTLWITITFSHKLFYLILLLIFCKIYDMVLFNEKTVIQTCLVDTMKVTVSQPCVEDEYSSIWAQSFAYSKLLPPMMTEMHD
jgi:hypothetical protein